MRFHIARTFLRALSRLDGQSQSLVRQAAFDFQVRPEHPSRRYHRIRQAASPGVWSFRVNDNLRIIVHQTADTLTLCHCDHHDAAYRWAERHRIEPHPTTGALQLVSVVEQTEVVRRQVVEEEVVTLPPLASMETEFLLRLGVPTEWVDWVREASEEALMAHIDRLPEAVGLRIIELMCGGTVSPPAPLPERAAPDIHPDAARDFAPVRGPQDLAAALAAPWEEWLIFLHPDQRAKVERHYSGPARISGSAGTGKTVVALHRAVWLARQQPDARILLTTFTRALTGDLSRRLAVLVGGGPEQIMVRSLHACARRIYEEELGKRFVELDRALLSRLIDEGLAANPRVRFPAGFVRSEWDAVIDPYGVRSRAAYFTAPRRGRGQGLGKLQKAGLWKVFAHVLAGIEAAGQCSFRGMCAAAAGWLEAHPDQRPFDHLIADEAQDLSHTELRFLRALVAPGPDDLFLVGDAAQRLYGRQCSWLGAGVDVRGNASTLTINYRTTEQIRAASESLLPDVIEAIDGVPEGREARSVRQGPAPQVVACTGEEDEVAALAGWLSGLAADGIAPESVGIFVRAKRLYGRVDAAATAAGVPLILLSEDDGRAGAVRLGTMHSAKGLEFRAVALVGCDAETLPPRRVLEAVADRGDAVTLMEQERNLLYVASSRARDRLFVSYTGQPSSLLSALHRPPPAPPRRPQAPPRRPRTPRTDFKIGPSLLGSYFGFQCSRYLRQAAAWSEPRRTADAVPAAPAVSPLQQAIFDSGLQWEEEVLARLIPPDQLYAPEGEGPLSERSFTPEESLHLIRTAPVGAFLYQAVFTPSPRFYARFGLDRSRVTVSQNRPDLLQVLPGEDGRRVIRVIDMKRGHKLRATYRIQLLMYALQLEDILADVGETEVVVDTQTAAIWLGGTDTPTPCSITAVRPHLERLLRDELPEIFSRPPNQVDWHVNYRCEWCPYLKTCWAQMQETDDVSRLPRLTSQGKAFLLEEGLPTVGALHRMLEDDPDDADALLARCASLALQRHQLTPRAEALQTGTVVPQGAAARGLTIPTDREIHVFLTLQREALGQQTYVAGYRIEVADGVPDYVAYRADEECDVVLLAESPARLDSLRRQLLTELYGILSRIDAYNLGQEWRGKLSVQFFVYSAAEQKLLQDLLFAGLAEPETARAAQTLLLYFQGPDLLLASRHPADPVPLPITVLLSVLGRVLAVPVPVSYTLPETLQALGVDHPRDDNVHLPLSPNLRSELLYAAWYGGDAAALGRIRAHLHAHLAGVSALFHTMRQQVERYHYAPKFALPTLAALRHPLLSRVAFFARYESLIGCRQVQDARMIARRAVRYSSSVLELEAVDAATFAVLETDPVVLEPSGFGNWLLVRDTPDGRRAQVQYNDYHWRSRDWAGRQSPHLAVVALKAIERDAQGFASQLTLTQKRKLDGAPPAAGERFLLYPRFSDSLTDRTLAFLDKLAAKPDGLFLDLLTRPESITAPDPITVSVDGLTESQQAALAHLCQERVLALWGPPGTGKTHFLATAILALIRARRAEGRPLRVLITAFTHAAVENVLRKLLELGGSDVPLAKGGRWAGGERPGGVKVVAAKKVPEWAAASEQCVLGGTVWSFDKHFGALDFDLVVVDEASQVRVPEASIAVSMVAPQGRLVFAGDHLQLPPIVSGEYPEPEDDGVLLLHRSIFELVCGLQGGRFQRALSENFRMNRTLTRVSSALLYGPNYQCGTDAIAAQRLDYTPRDGHSGLVRACLDPARPMVVVLLSGLPSGKDSAAEAALVAELTLALREGGDWTDDAAFFSKGVFIVSPHHSQLHRIRRALDQPARHAWTAPPFADTVDKMQGQEAEAVLVSYGVSDAEFARREAEFIYSLNRLNVSITRGRCKTVVLLSEALLQVSPEVLDEPRIERGVAHMRGLVELLRAEGREEGFRLPGGVSASVWSLGPDA